MPHLNLHRVLAIGIIAVFLALCVAGDLHLRAEPSSSADTEGEVRVARLMYANGKTSKCFAEGFLDLADRKMESSIQRKLDTIKLEDEKIFAYPFIIMTGEGGFSLSDKEKENLKAYIERGGFLLASAGCSSQPWADSFTKVIDELLPEYKLEEMDSDHPLFHTLYEIDRIDARKDGRRGAMYGLTIDGRLSCVFSPLGLNDTGNAGGGCCCCGGNEVRNAKEINANILAYALTH